MQLLLFDIDGTLMSGAHLAHRAALAEAVEKVYGITDPGDEVVVAAGLTDSAIARKIVTLGGIDTDHFELHLADFKRVCVTAYARLCPPTLTDTVVTGMGALLRELSTNDKCMLSLLTGNYEPIARLKLARGEIGGYFVAGQGGFGSDRENRAELGPVARARAADHPREQTIVIGDTPRDIACARADGLAVIAVTSGPYSAAELDDADGVATDVEELRSLLGERLV